MSDQPTRRFDYQRDRTASMWTQDVAWLADALAAITEPGIDYARLTWDHRGEERIVIEFGTGPLGEEQSDE